MKTNYMNMKKKTISGRRKNECKVSGGQNERVMLEEQKTIRNRTIDDKVTEVGIG